MVTLKAHMKRMQKSEGASWNPRVKSLVVVADSDGVSPKKLGLQIYAELWKEHFIIENTILIATRDNYIPINGKNYTDGLRKDTLDLYTRFPYERGRCGDVTDVTLLDQWRLRKGMFIHNANLFPLKIPHNFHGYQIIAATLGTPPYIILTGNSTDSDGNVVYNLGGEDVKPSDIEGRLCAACGSKAHAGSIVSNWIRSFSSGKQTAQPSVHEWYRSAPREWFCEPFGSSGGYRSDVQEGNMLS